MKKYSLISLILALCLFAGCQSNYHEHTVEEWKVVTPARCDAMGQEEGVCTVCGLTQYRNIPRIAHTPGEWEVEKEATKSSRGKRVKKCKVCGAELESEYFDASKEDLAKIESKYKNDCESISTNDLLRSPSKYEGKKIKLSGTVFQVVSEASSSQYLSVYFIRCSSGDLCRVRIDNYGADERILEDDYITVWGKFKGLYTYETVRGSSNTILDLDAEYYKQGY